MNTSRGFGRANIPVYSGNTRNLFWIFQDFFKGDCEDPRTHILKFDNKCIKMVWLVLKWYTDHSNIPSTWGFDPIMLRSGFHKIKKDNFSTRFIPEIPVLAIPLYSGIFQAGIFPPLDTSQTIRPHGRPMWGHPHCYTASTMPLKQTSITPPHFPYVAP